MNTDKTLLRSVSYLALTTVILLLIPLIAMLFSEDVVWTISDFIFAGALIFGTGLTYILVTRQSTNITYCVAVGFALFSGLFLIWSYLAVRNHWLAKENNEFNALYFLVIAVGVIGAFVSRFRSIGLGYTMFVMAATQSIIAITALITGMADLPHSSVYEIVAVNGFFITLFLVAAMLFQYSRQDFSGKPSTTSQNE
ncbi:hypothetical protein [Rhodohalobacter sp.]|uniref:hypothetical protein n=1 Tax=Rhodohalobacter sp. TaxID=1974210 RepID=UPI002ACDA4AF|nr:hypothetical protein [Rhodohalobacter sp.]MDZ7756329.1 hypothetical protein [Rhodohalobacter sp.]